MLDLSFRGSKCVFHLHVLLHSNRAIREVRVQALWEHQRGENSKREDAPFGVLVKYSPKYLGPISFARRELLICILIRCNTIVVRLIIVLAVTAVSDSHTFQDKFDIVWSKEAQNS